jgi:hypothetical protein
LSIVFGRSFLVEDEVCPETFRNGDEQNPNLAEAEASPEQSAPVDGGNKLEISERVKLNNE